MQFLKSCIGGCRPSTGASVSSKSMQRLNQGDEPGPIRVRASEGRPCLEQWPHALPARPRGEVRQEERLITFVLTELTDQNVSP
jgi:hypothetical protein